MDTLVFVYGTLKKGFLRHSALEGAKYIGDFKTSPNYLMYHVPAGYPALVEAEEGKEILGEVYQVDQATLSDLDRIEGVPYLYERAQMSLQDPDGMLEQPVIGYLFQRSVDNFEEIGNQWI